MGIGICCAEQGISDIPALHLIAALCGSGRQGILGAAGIGFGHRCRFTVDSVGTVFSGIESHSAFGDDIANRNISFICRHTTVRFNSNYNRSTSCNFARI